MNEHNAGLRTSIIIFATLFIAILLTIIPMPTWAIWLRPKWVVLVVIYWAFAMPSRFNVGSAWLVGLVLDLLQGTLMGEQALVISLIAYIVYKMHRRMQAFSYTHKAMTVLVLILFYQVSLFAIQSLLAHMTFSWYYWLPALTSALFWPWVYAFLKACQKYFRLVDPTLRGFIYGRE